MNYPTREEIRELTPDQRLQLLEDVWETFELEPESLELSEGHRALIESRLQQLERHPESTVSWDEVLHRLRKAS